MKKQITLLLIVAGILIFSGCLNKGQKDNSSGEEVSSVPDTGFTGIRKYYSQDQLAYEVTLRNGVREGLMTTYYGNGKVRQTFWYRNGMREDTAIWYHEDGKIFRKTPFRGDSIHGIQIQYYKSGAVRAKLEFRNGLRVPYLEEWGTDGKKITDYPDVVIKLTDSYKQSGTYKIALSLDKENVMANFYLGEYEEGLFTPRKYKKLNNSKTTGVLQLRKTGTAGNNYVGIIAEISTSLGNKQLVYKRIELPYNDLK